MQTHTTGALEGLRVIDFGQYIAGPLATMVLSDHGADVIRVDPPGGPRWNHRANAILQRGKRSIVLDLKLNQDRDVARRLVASADVVVENFRPDVMDRMGVGAEAMTADNRRLIYCSLPGFSRDDRRAGLPAWEGILGAATGHYTPGVVGGWAAHHPAEPNFSALPLASTFGAIIGVNSILAALIARERGGFGQKIEVPLFGAMFECIGTHGQRFPSPQRRYGHAACVVEACCSDGRWVYLTMATRRQYRTFAAAFFPSQWINEGLADPIALEKDEALAAEARRRIVELLAARPAHEWDLRVNAAGVPFTVCHTTQEWLSDNNAHATRAVIPLEDPELGRTLQLGHIVSMSATPPRATGPRAALDSNREAILAELATPPTEAPARHVTGEPSSTLGGALNGIRVVDVSQVLAGPTAGRVLAEFGAEVVKVNQPNYWIIGHVHNNSGKRNALIDLSRPEGKEVLDALADQCDVFLQNSTHGVADRLGIGEKDVRGRRHDIIYCSLSAYNHDGPRAAHRGYDPQGQAATGIMLRWGGGKPRMYRFTACDYAAGHLGAMAALLGLHHRVASGTGQHVQSSLIQAASLHQLPFMIDHEGAEWSEPSGPDAKGNGPLDRLYRAKDDWFYLAAVGPDNATLVSQITGVADISERSLSEAFAHENRAVWLTRFAAAGLASHELVEIEDLMEDPETKRQGFSIVRDHARLGHVRNVGPVPNMSRTPVVPTAPAAPPGSDTRWVVASAGFADRFAALAAAGVVAEALPEDEIVVS